MLIWHYSVSQFDLKFVFCSGWFHLYFSVSILRVYYIISILWVSTVQAVWLELKPCLARADDLTCWERVHLKGKDHDWIADDTLEPPETSPWEPFPSRRWVHLLNCCRGTVIRSTVHRVMCHELYILFVCPLAVLKQFSWYLSAEL